VACSVTGVGEHVMRALLARACADRMLDREVSVADACSRAIEEGILKVRARLSTKGHIWAAQPTAPTAILLSRNRATHQGNSCCAVSIHRNGGVTPAPVARHGLLSDALLSSTRLCRDTLSCNVRRRTGSRRTAACWP